MPSFLARSRAKAPALSLMTIDISAPSVPACAASISAWQNGAIFSQFGLNPPSARLQPTPDSGGDIQFLWPTVILQIRPSQVILGELIDAFPVYTIGIGAVSEDTMTDVNGDVYILFQNCNRTDSWTHFAIKRT